MVEEKVEKMDAGKLRYDLIPTSATRALAAVLTFGAGKYTPNGWRRFVLDPTYRDRWVAAAQRHLEHFRGAHERVPGPEAVLDGESGLPALWHLLCDVAFLIEQELATHDISDDEAARRVRDALAHLSPVRDALAHLSPATGFSCGGACEPCRGECDKRQ
jgi:hypothetical protein